MVSGAIRGNLFIRIFNNKTSDFGNIKRSLKCVQNQFLNKLFSNEVDCM